MQDRGKLTIVRLAPLVLVTIAAAFWFNDVQGGGPYVMRNLLPPVVVVALAAITLWRSDGTWTRNGWRWPLGTAGFAIPALGLTIYLHYAFSVNLNGMFDDAEKPAQLFRFLTKISLASAICCIPRFAKTWTRVKLSSWSEVPPASWTPGAPWMPRATSSSCAVS